MTDHIERKAALEEGVYRLEEPLENPSPDRREKYDFTKAPTFAPGLYRVVDLHRSVDLGDEVLEFVVTELHKVGEFGKLKHDDERFALLCEHLKPEPRSVATLKASLDHFDTMALEILQLLVDEGNATLDDLEEAYRTILERDGDGWE